MHNICVRLCYFTTTGVYIYLHKFVRFLIKQFSFQDYDGQARAEKLSRVIITLFGVGYYTSNIYVQFNFIRLLTYVLFMFAGGWINLGICYSAIFTNNVHIRSRICTGSFNYSSTVAYVSP